MKSDQEFLAGVYAKARRMTAEESSPCLVKAGAYPQTPDIAVGSCSSSGFAVAISRSFQFLSEQ